MHPGGKAMRAYVAVEGDEREQVECVAALNDAVGFIRHQLADVLSLRLAPDLHFVLDNSGKYGARIDELLHRIDKRGKKKTP
jgi:ribosome-binding factor A